MANKQKPKKSEEKKPELTDKDLEQIGGRAYLSTLSNSTPTAVHAVQYARIVERKAVLRNLIGAAGKIAGIGYEPPISSKPNPSD